MPTDPNPSLAPHSPSEPLPAELAQALAAGLGPFSLRELLALILNSLSQAERQAFLAGAPADKGNGSYARSLKMAPSLCRLTCPAPAAARADPAFCPRPTSA